MTSCSDQNTNSSWGLQSQLYNKAIQNDFRQQVYEFFKLLQHIIYLLYQSLKTEDLIWKPEELDPKVLETPPNRGYI